MRPTAYAILSLLLVAGCAATSDSATKIAGTSWRFTRIDGAPPVSNSAQISFEKDNLGASVGCNSMGGDWRVENERLIAGPLTQTEMYCAEALWDQEKALNSLLTSAPMIVVEGNRMTLKSHARSAELRKVA
jgi:heat shock protein HslJ